MIFPSILKKLLVLANSPIWFFSAGKMRKSVTNHQNLEMPIWFIQSAMFLRRQKRNFRSEYCLWAHFPTKGYKNWKRRQCVDNNRYGWSGTGILEQSYNKCIRFMQVIFQSELNVTRYKWNCLGEKSVWRFRIMLTSTLKQRFKTTTYLKSRKRIQIIESFWNTIFFRKEFCLASFSIWYTISIT